MEQAESKLKLLQDFKINGKRIAGGISFAIELTDQGYRATVIDDLGNPTTVIGSPMMVSVGYGSTPMEAIKDCIDSYPWDYEFDDKEFLPTTVALGDWALEGE